jgi:hypothetical protein
MITYNEESQTLEITEFISWEHCVKQVYQDEYDFRKDDAEVADLPEEFNLPAPDDLTKNEINSIMMYILDRFEQEDYVNERCGGGQPSVDEDFLQEAVADWCSDRQDGYL